MVDSPQSRGEDSLAGKRVLVVEDEFLIAIDIQRVLENANAIVVSANRVQQAIDLIDTSGPFDAAMLDLKLDRETSLPIAERLHAAGVPIVFLTGAPSDAAIAKQFKDAPVIAKPFDDATLFAGLKKAMAARR